MLILVRHAPPFRRWHRRLGERLETAGHAVGFEAAGKPVGRGVLAIERRLYGGAADWDAPEPAPPAGAGPADLTIVLAGEPDADGLVLRPEIAGVFGEAALLDAARAGTAPLVVVRGGAPGSLRPLASGRPAMEDSLVLVRALEDLLPRLVTLLVQAVARLFGHETCAEPGSTATPAAAGAAAFVARGLRNKLVRRFGAARGRPEHWRLALRRQGEDAWTLLLDDKSRFRADPCFFEEAGRLWLFFEDYPYATAKGVIACLAIDAVDSALTKSAEEARVVLEEDFHLSYPLVLRNGGAIYMLPETSAASRVQLYRADPFPHRWRPDAVLLDGHRLADATPILHEGRWWLFATSTDDGGSSWDQLHLFHAPDLLGPWTPHACNPVVIDAGSARPAGLMWHEDGVLMRPAQDCRRSYGDGLVICRVDRLDEGGFEQTIVGRMAPPSGLGATGLHTLNRAAGWEVVDLKTSHPER